MLDLNVAFAGPRIHRDGARARARWNRDTGRSCEGERLQEPQRLGQIAEAFAEKNPRRPCAKQIRSNRTRAGAANFDTKPDGDNRFMGVVLQELIFAAQFEIAEAICRLSFVWIHHSQSLSDFNAELRRNALGDIHRNIGLARAAIIRRSDSADSWKRKFVGDKRIVRRKRRREKSRPSESMAKHVAHRAELAHRANERKK